MKTEYKAKLRRPHSKQLEFINSQAKRKIIKAGRRGGKTVGVAIADCISFLKGHRVLYGSPTIEQVDRYWFEVCRALQEPIDAGVYKKNEGEHFIEKPGTENRIKAKTCWNANTLRGDYADKLTLDEWQLMAEDTWDDAAAPMLIDNNGDATFIFTPPSLYSSGVSRARDPRHASKMFKKAQKDTTGRWEAFHFTSMDNPYISKEALADITKDMSIESYRREILAEDDDVEGSWLVYGAFKAETQSISRFNIPKEWPVYVGHDFGKANPAALFIAQNPGTGDFFIYNVYLPGGGRSAYEHTQEFVKITTGYNVIRRVGGNINTEDEIRQAYSAHGWPISPPKISKPNAQIDRVIGLMNLNKIFIFNDLSPLLTELSTCLWKIDEQGRTLDEIKDESRYHLLACLRYVGSDFVPETVVGDEIEITYGARF